jgi:hypothetical protein
MNSIPLAIATVLLLAVVSAALHSSSAVEQQARVTIMTTASCKYHDDISRALLAQ